MLEVGLTSVTFRPLGYQEILDYSIESGISCIEWGSDVHVPPTDPAKAREVKAAADKAGIRISSYGTYYYICEHEDYEEVFRQYLETAVILGAPIMRLWAGKQVSEPVSPEYYERAVKETRRICDMAAEYHVTLAFEFHDHTLCDNADRAISLYRDVDRSNLGLYYQCDLQLSEEENLLSLEKMLPYLKMVHVFYYENGVRRSIGDGEGVQIWTRIADVLRKNDVNVSLLFEFLKDASLEGLKKESEIMHNILA